jgi:NADH-quinone oxidoreductase subunit L
MSRALLAVPALPVLAAIFSVLMGRRLPWRGGEFVVGATALAVAALLFLKGTHVLLQETWFASGGLQLTVGLELNGLTWLAAMVVAGVSFFVALYSVGYMQDEQHQPRFFAELALFIGAMLTLVLASSLVLLFAAWETVGIASYLLIGFRYEEEGARDSAAQAFLMTRVGDVGFLLGWLLVLVALRTTDIATLLSSVQHSALSPGMLCAIAGLLFVGAVGKSAQLPLTMWLPDAMVAPTPVSALLHSATMVAAGVFILLRLYPLFAAVPELLSAVFWVGAVTALFAALAATAETDLKRVLAWSTSSHLGEMMLAVGLGGPLAAALHLVTHASFKSALFLAAGSVGQYTGTRDLRRLRGLGHRLPATTLAFVLGALALAGIQPFFLGSSEEAIVATARSAGSPATYLMLGLIFLSGVYISRVGVAVFFGKRPLSDERRGEHSLPMLIGMFALAIAASLGTWIVALVPRVLPFGPNPSLSWPWRVTVMLASTTGLAAGAWHAWRCHAAPTFGPWSAALSRALATATMFPLRIVQAIAHAVLRAEGGLDALTRAIASTACALAAGCDRLERQEFGDGGDRLVEALHGAGDRLRRFESGKLYLYTLGLFICSLLVIAASFIAVRVIADATAISY